MENSNIQEALKILEKRRKVVKIVGEVLYISPFGDIWVPLSDIESILSEERKCK